MTSRLLFRAIALVALGGGLAIAHSLIPPKHPILLGTPKPPESGPFGVVPNPVVTENGQSRDTTTPTTASTPPTQAGPGLNITTAEAFEFFQKGVSFVDSRNLDEYTAGHIENAFYLTADQLISGKGLAVMSMLDPKAPVVVYCGGGMCDASKNLVNYLQAAGFTRCHIMHDGYPAWLASGHPTAQGAPEIAE